jgi:hypothetical protein
MSWFVVNALAMSVEIPPEGGRLCRNVPLVCNECDQSCTAVCRAGFPALCISPSPVDYQLNHTEVADDRAERPTSANVLLSGPARLEMVLADKCRRIVGTCRDFDRDDFWKQRNLISTGLRAEG